jgi:hypothetical protein
MRKKKRKSAKCTILKRRNFYKRSRNVKPYNWVMAVILDLWMKLLRGAYHAAISIFIPMCNC